MTTKIAKEFRGHETLGDVIKEAEKSGNVHFKGGSGKFKLIKDENNK